MPEIFVLTTTLHLVLHLSCHRKNSVPQESYAGSKPLQNTSEQYHSG